MDIKSLMEFIYESISSNIDNFDCEEGASVVLTANNKIHIITDNKEFILSVSEGAK